MKVSKALKRIDNMRASLTTLRTRLVKNSQPVAPEAEEPKINKRSAKYIKCADLDLAAAASIEMEEVKG